jgi:Fe-S cluster assembly protein SufD
VSNVTDIRALYRDGFRQTGATLPGATVPWLRTLRARALEQFMESGFPTLKHEEWKYTDVRPIAMRRFAPLPAPGDVTPAALASSSFGELTLVFIDGHFAPALSTSGELLPGVQVMSLAQALNDHAEEIRPWLERQPGLAPHGFNALNTAFMQDGAFVRIGRDVAAPAPIQLLFVSTAAADSGITLRNVIVAQAGSQAVVVESYVASGPGTYLTNVITDVVTEAGAVLEHYRLEREAEAAYHIGGTHVRQARDSRYTSHSISLGGRIARHELHCALDAEGAQCALNGLYIGRGRQHHDHTTRIDHHVPRATSREWYKGILGDASRGVFSGRVVVHPQAQHSDAEQENHNLLLSEGAEADSRPQFEIYADDVKCSHGSSTGSLDPDALFYLRTRALDENAARGLLVYAFASDVLARMGLTPLRTALERDVATRLLGQPVPDLVT